jgi:Calx-beta domain
MVRGGRSFAAVVTRCAAVLVVAVSAQAAGAAVESAHLGTQHDRPVVHVGYVDVPEPLVGPRVVVLPVTLNVPSPHSLRVFYVLVGDTATLGVDVARGSGTITFRKGATEAYVRATVSPDSSKPTTTCWADVAVPCRTFSVVLHAVGGDVSTAASPVQDAIVWVSNATNTVAVGDAMVPAAPRRRTLDVPVALASPATLPVSVHYELASGSARSGASFVASSGTVHFPVGQALEEVSVKVLRSVGSEPDEVLFVDLSNAIGATIARSQGWAIIGTDAKGVPDPLARGYGAVTLTQVTSKAGRGDTYTVAATRLGSRISAPAGQLGTSDRMIFWPRSEVPSEDQESCATWSSQTPVEAPHIPIQEGLAVRATTEDGVTRAITVTKNVYANAFWVFNVHLWDTAHVVPFDLIGQVNLGPYFESKGGEVLPIDVCALVVGDTFQFEVWLADQPPPAWGTTSQGGVFTLPAGWDFAGRAGWYVGHLPADADVVYTNESAGPPQAEPAP